jgi:hypothetical protein
MRRTTVDVSLPARSSGEQLEQLPKALLYGLVLAWVGIAGLPAVVLTFGALGPLTAVGTLLVLVGQVWLFTQVFMGNPVAALLILLVPLGGLVLAIQFVIDHWRIAKWPVLCQLVGLVLWVAGVTPGVTRY